MKILTERGSIRIGFNFSDSSFNKVTTATDLFESNKAFLLITNDKKHFIFYSPVTLETYNGLEQIQYDGREQMQIKLGFDLMCYDGVLAAEDVQVAIDNHESKLIELL